MASRRVTAIDRLFMERALELARHGVGNTSPNPSVGAVVVRDGRTVGEGYHHKAGEPHAEVNALRGAGSVRGSTIYVTLEPCNHIGRTPACAQALIDAGVSRVVIGALDPNPKTNRGGVEKLRGAGVVVDILDGPSLSKLIEPFAVAIARGRPFLALKMAMSLDGRIADVPGVRRPLTGEPWRLYVRDLRIAYDAVMVGAGTVRVDDPQLSVRPPSYRLRPYKRIIACETDTVDARSRIFASNVDYDRTIVLAPAGARERFENLEGVAQVVFVGGEGERSLDLAKAMLALRDIGVQSVLCEGGPTLGARLIAAGLVDRFYWAIAPMLLTAPDAVAVLGGADLATLRRPLRFDGMEMVGADVVLTGTFDV